MIAIQLLVAVEDELLNEICFPSPPRLWTAWKCLENSRAREPADGF